MGGTEEPTRRRWNVGAWKLPHAARDIAHRVITAEDLRGYRDGMGSDRPDDDTKFPVGSKVAYSVMLTDAEAELFASASNARYVEPDVETHACAGNTVFPTGTAQKFMGMEFPGTDSWHGRDVNIAILDGGVTTAMRTYMGWTQVGRSVFGGFTPGADEITTDHGCMVAPCAVPRGGRILDAIISDDAGGSNASLFLSGVTWAVDNGADVINYSYAGTETAQAYNDAIEYAANGGAVIVASAGNRGVNAIDYPARFSSTYSNIYSSANFDESTSTLASSSNFHVDMSGCAPGNFTLGMAPDATPIRWSGTSASSPHMAGLVARVMTGGRFTAAQAAAALKSSARNTGATAAQQGAGAWDLKAALTQLGAMPTAVPLRTNLCVNPSMETPSTTGYSLATARGGITLGNSGTGTAVAGHAGPTYAFFNVTGDGSTSVNPDADLGGPTIAVTAGLPYTFSAHIRWGATQGRVRLLVRWRNSASAIISDTLAPEEPLFSQSWTRYFITGTAPTGATQAQLRMQLFGATLTQAISFRWDAVQYEQSSSLGFYFDGATTPGGAWTGTAHASTSTVQVSTGTTFAGSATIAGAGAVSANGTVGTGPTTLAGSASIAGAGAVSAAATVPYAPGPVGDFSWKGLNWTRRADAGDPQYNGQWSASNVSGPDANGFITLNLTNPSGNSPFAAEMSSTRTGFGYGTYTCVIGTRLDTMNKATVFGGLFTYDHTQPESLSNNEIDICETSAWGDANAPIHIDHTYWIDDSNGDGAGESIHDSFDLTGTNIPVHTHQMIWSASQIVMRSYSGIGTGGTLLFETVITNKIPVPENERLHFNLWVFNQTAGGITKVNPATAPATSVVIRDFSYAPAQAGGTTLTAQASIAGAGGVSANGTVGSAARTPAQILNIGPGAGQNHFNLGVGVGSTHSDRSQSQIAGGLVLDPQFIQTADGQRVQFRVQLDAGTTDGSDYPRSELREFDQDGTTEATWNSGSGDHQFSGTSTVTHLPPNKSWVCFTQIHDSSSDMVRLQTEGTLANGLKLVARFTPDGGGTEIKTDVRASYTVGTTVAWEWRCLNGTLTLKLDGVQVLSHSASRTGCYFKAGAYAQTNETIDAATEYVAVELTDLRQWHTGWPTPTGDAPATLAGSASIPGAGGLTANATGGTGPVVGAPTVNAGADDTITSGAAWDSTATENDNGSAITARTWTIVAAPPGITVPQQIGTAARLVVRLTVAGEYTLRYAATNAAGTGTDDAVVECVPAATAAPVFVAVGTAATGSSTSVAVPAPAGVAAGDFQICVIADAGEETISGVPAGWTLLDTVVPTSPGGDPGGTHSTWIYYNTTGASATATWTKSGSRYFHAVRAAWRNQTALGEHTAVERASSTSVSISPVTPDRGSSIVVGVVVADLLNASFGPITPQATATERYDATTVSGTERETIAIAEIVSPNGQPRNLTWNASNADDTAVYAFVLEGPFAQIPADVAIDGAGQVTANAAAAGTAASADIDGSGGVSANAVPNRFASATIDGAGQVTAATAATDADGSASIAGVGQVSVAAPVSDVAVSASIAGAGTVSASSTVIPGGVGAGVDGAGAVTAAATLVLSVSAAIAGAGTLTTGSTPGLYPGDTTFLGDTTFPDAGDSAPTGGAFPGVAVPGEVFPGDSGAAASITHAAEATIAGDAAVSATTGGIQAAQASVAGAGGVSADATLLLSAQAAVVGDAAVATDLSLILPVQATVAGDAAVSADLIVTLPAQATIAGDAAVSATTGGVQAVQVTVAGDAAVSANADLVLAAQAAVAGAGTLAVDSTLTLSAQASLAGAGGVTATTGGVQAVQATLAGAGSVTGSASLDAVEPSLNWAAQAKLAGAGVVDAHATVRTPPNPDIEIGGATPHAAFWAVHPGTGALAPLPHVTGFELSPVRNEAGSIRIDYPIVGKNYERLRAVVDQDVQLEVEIWVGGSADGRMRGLILEATGDDVAEDGSWTFAGHFLEYRAHDALLAPDPTPGHDWETVFDNATPGVVVKTLWQAAQARGTLTDITTATFSTTHDSNGAPWSQAVYLSFAPHRHYDEILTDLVEAGVCEWEITPDHELRLYEPGSRGVDLTLDTPPLVLRRGRNLREAQRKFSSRDAGTDLWAAGGEGLYDTFSDASARARLGRQVERAISANSIIDEGALAAYIQNKIGEVTRGALELTLEIVFGAGQPLPRAAVNLGDWLWTDTGRGTATSTGLEYYRVAQWTLSSDGDELRGTFSLNDLMSERVSRLEKLLKAVAGGTVVVGASVATPDAKPPAAPQGLGASSLAYVDDVGKTLAAVTASWQAVTTNADGTALDDLAGYRIRYRYLNGGPPGWFDAGRVSSLFTSHVFSGVVIPGSTIAIQVQAYDRTQLESAWSAEHNHGVATDAIAPPVPSAPGVTARLGVITITWDGLGRFSEEMPADFDRVDVLYSTVADFTLTDAVYLDRFFAAGSTATAAAGYGQTVYVKLRSVDRSGNPSALSAQGSVVVPRGVADDIADDIIGAAKLADGAVTGPKIAPEAVTTPHLSVAAFSDNLVPNGGFEDRSLTDPSQPAGWAVLSASGTTAATLRDVSAGNVDSGSASLKVSLSAASGEVRVGSKPIPVRPGDLVLLQARVKASRAVTGMRWRIYVWPGHPDTTPATAAQVNAFNPFAVTTSFDTYEQQFTVPATLTVGTEAGAPPRFIQAVPAPGGVTGDGAALDVWLDEVRVRSVVGTAEIADAAIQRAKIANLAVGDAQIETASVGKLTAGTLSATVLLSGIIRTASTGARFETDAAGLRLYDSANVNTVNFNAATGSANMIGTLTAGVGGDRIVVQPSGAAASGVSLAEISFFQGLSGLPGYINGFAAGVGNTGLGLNSGNSAISGTVRRQTTLKLTHTDFRLFYNTAPGDSAGSNQLRGANIFGDDTVLDMGLSDSSGQPVSNLRADSSGFQGTIGASGVVAFRARLNGSTARLESPRFSGLGETTFFGRMNGVGGYFAVRNDGQSGDPILDADGHSPRFLKNFIIPHPTDNERWLVHACTETPEASVEYSGVAVIDDYEAVVQLPAYFEDATHQHGRQVWLQVMLPDEGFHRYLPRAIPSLPKDGQFRISSDADDGTRVSWRVKAIRKDVPELEVEPLKTAGRVRGDGPYTYFVPGAAP